ncbi:hypothetical protein DFJ73DRAFT_770346 [Zopfochytrium polystomum]|nr:hypothetical protein DFJ73DRAFT_770346 [Zopfochytrium polystomum]
MQELPRSRVLPSNDGVDDFIDENGREFPDYVFRAATKDDVKQYESGNDIRSSSHDPNTWRPKVAGAAHCVACHIGNDHQQQSDYISTTRDLATAKKYTAGGTDKILKIGLKDMTPDERSRVIDMSTEEGRNAVLLPKENDVILPKGPTRANFNFFQGLSDVSQLDQNKTHGMNDRARALGERDGEVLFDGFVSRVYCKMYNSADLFRSRHTGGLYRRAGNACKQRVTAMNAQFNKNAVKNADGTLDIKATLAKNKASTGSLADINKARITGGKKALNFDSSKKAKKWATVDASPKAADASKSKLAAPPAAKMGGTVPPPPPPPPTPGFRGKVANTASRSASPKKAGPKFSSASRGAPTARTAAKQKAKAAGTKTSATGKKANTKNALKAPRKAAAKVKVVPRPSLASKAAAKAKNRPTVKKNAATVPRAKSATTKMAPAKKSGAKAASKAKPVKSAPAPKPRAPAPRKKAPVPAAKKPVAKAATAAGKKKK